jgi:serine/threonine-protein kinase
MALDRDGNLYYTIGTTPTPSQLHPRGTLMKLAPDAAAPTVVAPLPKEGLSEGLAVDSTGTLYVDVDYKVFRMAAGTTSYTEIDLGLNLENGPEPGRCQFAAGLAVGPSDDLYATCSMGSEVVRFTAGSMQRNKLLTLPKGFKASDIAVDSGGTIYLTADPIYTGAGRVVRVGPGETTPSDVPVTGLLQSDSIAVDGNDNVYVCDATSGQVIKLTRG